MQGWAHATSKAYDPLTSHSIAFADLKQCLTDQRVELRIGDILIIRVGYVESSSSADEGKLRELQTTPTFAGLEQSEDMKRFLYESGVAMVASDSPTFERWRASSTDRREETSAETRRSDCRGLLPARIAPRRMGRAYRYVSGFRSKSPSRLTTGSGEMFDLEELAKTCTRLGRTSFFFRLVASAGLHDSH